MYLKEQIKLILDTINYNIFCVWYNRNRLYSVLGYKTLIKVENEFNNVA